MSRSVNHFKISNMPDSYTTTLVFISIIVFLVGGIGAVYSLITAFEIPDAIVAILVLIIVILGFGTPFLVGAGLAAEIDYDGKHIRIDSFFKKQEIDLEHVKSITYRHESGSGRYRVDGIMMEFTLYGDSEDPGAVEETVSLYDSLRGDEERTDIDKLIKGDHSDFPLLMMYDDIIGRYPDKKAPEDGKSEKEDE